MEKQETQFGKRFPWRSMLVVVLALNFAPSASAWQSKKRDDPRVETAEVRKSLPADSVLIEIAKFDVVDLKAKGKQKQWGGPRYAAWIIPPAEKGEVRLINLCPADKIDVAVAD